MRRPHLLLLLACSQLSLLSKSVTLFDTPLSLDYPTFRSFFVRWKKEFRKLSRLSYPRISFELYKKSTVG